MLFSRSIVSVLSLSLAQQAVAMPVINTEIDRSDTGLTPTVEPLLAVDGEPVDGEDLEARQSNIKRANLYSRGNTIKLVLKMIAPASYLGITHPAEIWGLIGDQLANTLGGDYQDWSVAHRTFYPQNPLLNNLNVVQMGNAVQLGTSFGFDLAMTLELPNPATSILARSDIGNWMQSYGIAVTRIVGIIPRDTFEEGVTVDDLPSLQARDTCAKRFDSSFWGHVAGGPDDSISWAKSVALCH